MLGSDEKNIYSTVTTLRDSHQSDCSLFLPWGRIHLLESLKRPQTLKETQKKKKKNPKALVIILTVLNTAMSEVTVNYLTLLWFIWH